MRKLMTGAIIALAMAAGPALADGPGAPVEALMTGYFKLWNANDGAAITSRIYQFDQTTNPMQTLTGFNASYAQLKGQGYDHSVLKSVHACLLTPNLAMAELRYSRMKTDGTAMPPADRAGIYMAKKTKDGWRISQIISMDASAKLDCASFKG